MTNHTSKTKKSLSKRKTSVGKKRKVSVGKKRKVSVGKKKVIKKTSKKSKRPNVYDYEIYTKEGCPYCVLIKELLTSRRIKFKNIPITLSNRNMLLKKTNNYRYIPIVFYKNKFIGGYDDVFKKLNKDVV